MALVLKAVPLEAPRRERQHRIFAIKCLNMSLFIHAEDRRVCGRVQVQLDDICRLLLEVRIIRGHVALETVGLQAVLAPHSGDHHVADNKALPEPSGAPVRRAVLRPGARGFQDPCLKLRRQYRSHLSYVSAVKARQTLLLEALRPAGHKPMAARHPLAGVIPRMALGQQQDQPSATRIFRASRSARCPPLQFHTFYIRQVNGVAQKTPV